MNYITAYAWLQSDDFLAKLVVMAVKSKQPNKRKTVLFLVGTIAVIVGIYLGIRQVMIVQEKAKFEAAATELEALRKQIEQKIGKADDSQTEKSCGYSSAKFSKGRLSCSTAVELYYPASSHEIANKRMDDISNLFATKPDKDYVLDRNSFVSMNESKLVQSFTHNIIVDGFAPRKCLASYTFPANDATQESIKVRLSCFMESKGEHYPVKE